MQLIDTPAFLSWASTHGIGWDPRYPGTHSLTYLATPGFWRPWDTPADVGQLSWFVEAVLDLAAPELAPLIVLPRDRGLWRFGGERVPLRNEALDVVARATGVPAEYQGAVRFDSSERARVIALATASLVFGWGTGEDLYVFPEDAGCILMTDHHKAFIGQFRSSATLEAFTAALVESGYTDPAAASA